MTTTKTRTARPSTSSKDVYQEVTDRIVKMLEEGTVPWHQPWRSTSFQNIEGHVYRGINVFLLLMTSMERGYASPYWLTFNQAKARGGKVKKGEHGTMVVFWKRLSVEDKDNPGQRKVIPLLRYYYVFNVEQTEGVKLPKRVTEHKGLDFTPEESAEAVIAGYAGGRGPSVTEAGDEAYWQPATDLLVVPPRANYDTVGDYYSTLFHEFTHSTGHKSRLDRKVANAFGSHDYGREELVAEMGSAFLCAETGVERTLDNSASYISSWLRVIKADNKAVVTAAGQAQRAVDYILNRTFEDRESEQQPVVMATN